MLRRSLEGGVLYLRFFCFEDRFDIAIVWWAWEYFLPFVSGLTSLVNDSSACFQTFTWVADSVLSSSYEIPHHHLSWGSSTGWRVSILLYFVGKYLFLHSNRMDSFFDPHLVWAVYPSSYYHVFYQNCLLYCQFLIHIIDLPDYSLLEGENTYPLFIIFLIFGRIKIMIYWTKE